MIYVGITVKPSDNPVVRKIVSQLPSLTAEEKTYVLGALKASNVASGVAAGALGEQVLKVGRQADVDATFVLDILCRRLASLGVERANPNALIKASQYQSFKTKVPDLMQWLKDAGCTTRHLQSHAIGMGFELLYKDNAARGFQVGSRPLMAQVHRIPNIINQQFPGYGSSGLLSWAIKREA